MKNIAFTLGLALATSACANTQTQDPNSSCQAKVPPLALKQATLSPHSAANPWWHDAVFYEVFVRSFADSKYGPLACDGKGDIQGLIENLDYLNDGDPSTNTDLGVTALWLMPIMESPSYHGYDVTDYFKVNPEYGTEADLKRLIEAAHSRGIRIVIDMVLNHASMQHPKFLKAVGKQEPFHDWFVWRDSQQLPDKQYGSWQQPLWHPAGKQSYYGVFWSGMPDWNLRNPKVTNYLYKSADYWLKDVGVDGFRLDAVRYLIENEDGETIEDTAETHQWLKQYYQHVKQAKADAMVVNEIWASTAIIEEYKTQQMDLAFMFDTATEMLSASQSGSGSGLGWNLFETQEIFGNNNFATFLTNHDQPRVMTELVNDRDAAKRAAAMLLTGPGVPFIYYGEEIGMTGNKPDEKIRTPLQWNATTHAGFTAGKRAWQRPNRDYTKKNIAQQQQQADSLWQHYRSLIELRQQYVALRQGIYIPLESSEEGVYAFMRRTEQQTVLVLINLTDAAIDQYQLNQDEFAFDTAFKQAKVVNHNIATQAPVLQKGFVQQYQPIASVAPNTTYVIELK